MAEKETESKAKGWWKAFLGTIAGLCSGAAVMYLTPLVNKVIQPAKPVANFEAKPDGFTVRFQNLSNVAQGTWDFGDGTPLQPVGSQNEFITHKFPAQGDYTVKLSVHNILNEENDRTVVVKLGDAAAASTKPTIIELKAIPMSAGNMAPATFRLASQVENAQLCVWELGEGRIKVEQDTAPKHDRMVVFKNPGRYTIQLVAVNGSVHENKTVVVEVASPPVGVATAIVSVTDVGKKLERKIYTPPPMHAWFAQHETGNVCKIVSQTMAEPGGYTIADVRIPLPDNKEIRMGNNTEIALDGTALGQPAARNLKLTLSQDRQSLKLTGEMVRDNPAAPPRLTFSVEITEQREVAAGPTEVQLAQPLGVPGSAYPSAGAVALPALPPDWITSNRSVRVELDDGKIIRVNTTQLPTSSQTTVAGFQVMFNAMQVKNQVNVSLTDAKLVPVLPLRSGAGGD